MKPELLAPAGNMQSLVAAIEAGCDAVYLGGHMFGARSFAGNFSNEELIDAVEYAHLRNVKVYVTTNTLVYESEVEEFMSYIDFLYRANVDAILMQDLGMMDLVRKTYPDLEIHASTQMHIHTVEGVLAAQKLGIKRAVVARETDVDTIQEMKKTGMEIEVFVHGALCISYSGQCFMSSFLGGRSGNRGTCAQCCRQYYILLEEENGKTKKAKEGYLLSTRDLNTLDSIGTLIDLGVDSLKIEGRMKRPEYVYYVVSLYRKAIDSYIENGEVIITEEEIKNLKKLFNRTFTKGFLFQEKNDHFIHSFRPNHLGIEIGKVISVNKKKVTILLSDSVSIHDGVRILGSKEDVGCILNVFYKNGKLVKEAHAKDTITFEVKGNVKVGEKVLKTTDSKQLSEIEKQSSLDSRKVPLKGICTIKKEKPVRLELFCGDTSIVLESEEKIEASSKIPTKEEDVMRQLRKIGNTVYEWKELTISLEENLFVPMNILSHLRRDAILFLNQKRLERKKAGKKKYEVTLPNFDHKKELTFYARTKESYERNKNKKYDAIYMEEPLYSEIKEKNIILKLPRVMNTYPKYKGHVLVGELGSIFAYSDFSADFSFHVTNSYTLAFLHSMGAKKVTLSYECNKEQIKEILSSYENRYHVHPNVEVIVSGYLEAMIMKYHIFKDYYLEGHKLYLEDHLHHKYLLEDKKDYVILYHHEKRNWDDYDTFYNMGVNSLRIEE